ncbi:response regulator transcription factor [Alteromonas sp. AMM-1]|uniref:response regulator transcription factor n=1 Tax=Alteromonas sp. AMM-1 TaxID=3394233 RepID=UPI0039A68B18
MRPRILVIDDEVQIQRFMKISLAAEGFEYISALNATDGLKIVREQSPDIIILDLGLPDKDGSWLLSQLRVSSQTPVLVLTARDEEDEKVRLLNEGANDYLSKPFGIKELIARIKVLLRDLRGTTVLSPVLMCGDLSIDTAQRTVRLKNFSVPLTKKEYCLLRYLMSNPNALFTHQQLLHHIWGETHTDDTHYLRILVSQLRKKLEDDSNAPKYIITEPGIGYRLLCPVEHCEV